MEKIFNDFKDWQERKSCWNPKQEKRKEERMPKNEKAQSESLFDFLRPSLENFKSFIAEESKKIKQNEKDQKKFSKLVNIKRGLS